MKGTLVAGPGKKWLLGCGLGCGIPVLLLILATVGGGIVMMKPFNRAVEAQKELTAEYGERADYVPVVDGLTPERLAKFMNIRRVLVPYCASFSEIGDKFQHMNDLETDGEEASRGEVFSAVGNVMGAALGLAGNIGRFTGARNDALLSEEMGLGEYVWIYTLVYHSWLGHPPNTDFEDNEGSSFGSDDRRLIRQLMTNHAAALGEAGRTEEAEAWTAEVGHLERSDGAGVPWADHTLPATVVEALAPFEVELGDLYCPETAAFEFSRVKKKGLTITSD